MPSLIVEKSSDGEDDAWLVHPCPGFVFKFREVCIGKDLFGESEKHKLFLNICHCPELPPPIEDLNEDEVAEILDSSDPSRYKIPLSIGELECICDNRGENSAKIDVIVNSTFFLKHLENSEFFRQLLLLVCSDAISAKHEIQIDVKNAIRLKNRKVMGELIAQRVRKKPQKSFIQEVKGDDKVKENKEQENGSELLRRPKNYQIIVHNGKEAEIKVKIPESTLDFERVQVKMNDDRLLVLLDASPKITDIFVPFEMDFDNARAQLTVSDRTLKITVPIHL